MVIVVSHQKGGVGKSTLCWNLAGAYKEMMKKQHYDRIIVFDADKQETLSSINELRKLKKNATSSDVNILRVDIDDMLLFYKDGYEKATDIIIVDVGGFDSIENRKLIVFADIIITPVSDNAVDLLGLGTYQSVLNDISEEIGHQIKAKVVLNKINPSKGVNNINEIKNLILNDYSHFDVLDSVVRNYIHFNEAMESGKFISEQQGFSLSLIKAKNQISDLAKEILSFRVDTP